MTADANLDSRSKSSSSSPSTEVVLVLRGLSRIYSPSIDSSPRVSDGEEEEEEEEEEDWLLNCDENGETLS